MTTAIESDPIALVRTTSGDENGQDKPSKQRLRRLRIAFGVLRPKPHNFAATTSIVARDAAPRACRPSDVVAA